MPLHYPFVRLHSVGLNTSAGSNLVKFNLTLLAVDTVHNSDQTLELEVRYNKDDVIYTQDITINLQRTDADEPQLIVEARTTCTTNALTAGLVNTYLGGPVTGERGLLCGWSFYFDE